MLGQREYWQLRSLRLRYHDLDRGFWSLLGSEMPVYVIVLSQKVSYWMFYDRIKTIIPSTSLIKYEVGMAILETQPIMSVRDVKPTFYSHLMPLL